MASVLNFSAGPAKIPKQVLLKAQAELLNWNNTGISVLEMSHRSADFDSILNHTIDSIRELLAVPNNYKILFMLGGGTGQFAGVPLNLVSDKQETADYLVTGSWSSKAAQEAEKYITVNRVLPKTKLHTGVPDASKWKLSADAKYVYYCDNETIHGIEYDSPPDVGDKILISDMSSNILSRPVDVSKFGLIYAGAQKNIGCAGVTLVIVREDLIKAPREITPSILDLQQTADNNSMMNTPCTFGIYIVGLVCDWIRENGGVAGMQKLAEKKSQLIYSIIDGSNGFYRSPIESRYRSRMNVVFRIYSGDSPCEDLEKKFLDEAKKRGMIQLKGHRSVGGLRASLYNAVTLEETQQLADLMRQFPKLV